MDNLTHTATGFLLARAGLNRFGPHATAVAMIAANAPDLDVVSLAFGPVAYLHYHRWLTHSLVALPLMAAVPLLFIALYRLLRKQSGPVRWGALYAVSVIGVASHLLLDFTNAYGIRLMLPFSDAMPALDSTSVVDFWIWTSAVLAILGPGLSRLVSSEIGSKKPSSGRGWAIFFVLFLCFYDGARYTLSRRAIAVQEARMYEGENPRRVLVMPDPANPMNWAGFVETDSYWIEQKINLLRESHFESAHILHKPEPSPAFERVKSLPAFHELIAFSHGLFWSATPAPEGATLVRATDVRFGFEAEATLDPSGQVLHTGLGFTNRGAR